jgi:hypothetical protein
VSDLPGGSFDANMSFAQVLTEAVKAAPQTLVVATIPSSDAETGGEGGQEAADRLQRIFGRLESPWRPADAEEGFEIVRRRLFQDIGDPTLFVARDAIIKAYMELYRTQPQEFPSNCREAEYERRLKWPIRSIPNCLIDSITIGQASRSSSVLAAFCASWLLSCMFCGNDKMQARSFYRPVCLFTNRWCSQN